jgi:hypothetical protein
MIAFGKTGALNARGSAGRVGREMAVTADSAGLTVLSHETVPEVKAVSEFIFFVKSNCGQRDKNVAAGL